jgi:hypothetical protein
MSDRELDLSVGTLPPIFNDWNVSHSQEHVMIKHAVAGTAVVGNQ